MKIPSRYSNIQNTNLVFKLRKTLYGLKQSSSLYGLSLVWEVLTSHEKLQAIFTTYKRMEITTYSINIRIKINLLN